MSFLDDIRAVAGRLRHLIACLDTDLREMYEERRIDDLRIARMENNVEQVRVELEALDARIAIIAREAGDLVG